MAKRNKQIDAEVIACASAGMTTREIAKKFTMSPTTISRILNDEKNLQNVTKAKKVVQNFTEENAEEIKRTNQRKAHDIINEIFNSLEKDIKTASVKDKRETLKTLVELYGLPEEEEKDVTGITITIEDASGGENAT